MNNSQPTPTYNLILCTCPTTEIASKIATELVTQKYAACVNIMPKVKSVYSWQGKIESSEEQLLIIKTTNELFKQVESCIKGIHPYACPEIIALPITNGNEEYLQWIESNTVKI